MLGSGLALRALRDSFQTGDLRRRRTQKPNCSSLTADVDADAVAVAGFDPVVDGFLFVVAVAAVVVIPCFWRCFDPLSSCSSFAEAHEVDIYKVLESTHNDHTLWLPRCIGPVGS